MDLSEPEARRRLAEADHGVLATHRPDGRLDLVPAVFAVDGDRLAIPIDRLKTKRPGPLQRVRNLEADPRATLLVEQWDADDWARLWWVRARLERIAAGEGDTAAFERLLRARYPQYARMPDSIAELVVFRVTQLTGWSAT